MSVIDVVKQHVEDSIHEVEAELSKVNDLAPLKDKLNALWSELENLASPAPVEPPVEQAADEPDVPPAA